MVYSGYITHKENLVTWDSRRSYIKFKCTLKIKLGRISFYKKEMIIFGLFYSSDKNISATANVIISISNMLLLTNEKNLIQYRYHIENINVALYNFKIQRDS